MDNSPDDSVPLSQLYDNFNSGTAGKNARECQFIAAKKIIDLHALRYMTHIYDALRYMTQGSRGLIRVSHLLWLDSTILKLKRE